MLSRGPASGSIDSGRSGDREIGKSRVEMGFPYGWPVFNGCASSTRDRSRMREFRTYGSVRGAPSNGRPYRVILRKGLRPVYSRLFFGKN